MIQDPLMVRRRPPYQQVHFHFGIISVVVLNEIFRVENASYYAELEERHKELVGETVEVGLMFASKAFVQLLANPIVGPLTHK